MRLEFSLSALLFAVALSCLATLAQAEEARPVAADPVAEARLQALAGELRCLVCQNETIAASNAELAQDLRRQIRQMIQTGKSDADIRKYMVDRYGDFVLYKPPFQSNTLLLWFLPPALFLAAVAILLLYIRRRGQTRPAELSEEARRRAAELLKEKETP
ncbi:MAG: cytochrome c-type biogenesis protein CcmH [Zoogloeaceae bacterium]|nr:cytochrome c-type biogenesis protein CcmH [Zoogloeaceae bacterium]